MLLAHACLLGALAAPGFARPARADLAPVQPTPEAMTSLDPPEGEVHDHAPRHGGVVGMSGSRHIEATATSGGVLRFYLTDFRRAPLPLAGVRATVTVGTGDARRTVDVVVEDGALVARTTPLDGKTVDARLDATLPDERILVDFTLPVTAP